MKHMMPPIQTILGELKQLPQFQEEKKMTKAELIDAVALSKGAKGLSKKAVQNVIDETYFRI